MNVPTHIRACLAELSDLEQSIRKLGKREQYRAIDEFLCQQPYPPPYRDPDSTEKVYAETRIMAKFSRFRSVVSNKEAIKLLSETWPCRMDRFFEVTDTGQQRGQATGLFISHDPSLDHYQLYVRLSKACQESRLEIIYDSAVGPFGDTVRGPFDDPRRGLLPPDQRRERGHAAAVAENADAEVAAAVPEDCVVCMESPANRGFAHPEGIHVVLCSACAKEYKRAKKHQCPVCNIPAKIVRVEPGSQWRPNAP
jgi:hypothetical protein